jgi:hypothetical protein
MWCFEGWARECLFQDGKLEVYALKTLTKAKINYALKTLTKAKINYVQIEKEMLIIGVFFHASTFISMFKVIIK